MRHNQQRDDSLQSLFSSLLGDDVTPLKGDKVAQVRQNPTLTLAQKERQRAAAARHEPSLADGLSDIVREWVEPQDAISWRRDGVQDGVFRNLKRGRYAPTATLNLHHHSAQQARYAVAEFAQECLQKGIRNALIIHGLGKQSKPRPGLLKNLCRQWLPDLDPVLALHSACPQHGGAGATYVMIRKSNAAKIANKERNRRR